MCKTFSEEINAEVKKAGEVITKKEEKQETVKSAEATMDTPVDAPDPMPKAEMTQDTTCQVIGHVPLPGSGTGKGTGVKK